MGNPIEKKLDRRIIAMMLLVIVLFAFAAMRIFEFQVVDGEKYLNDTQKNSAATITVSAARGEIVDRKGVPFTKNKAVFNVEFEYIFMQKGTENEIIRKLISLFEKQNNEWIDEIPITKTEPYEFLPNKETEVKRLKKALVVNSYATAQDCMQQIYRQCSIKKYKNDKGKCTHCGEKFEECTYSGYSEKSSRQIAGVRAQMLQKEFSQYNTRYCFAEDIPPQTVALIREFSTDFVGVEIVEKAIRTYVSGDVASHIIGSMGPIYAEEVEQYTNEKGYSRMDIVGKSGIEKEMEAELHGINGTMEVVKNSKGDIIDIKEVKPPVAGKTIQLTIDLEFQREVQKIVAEYIEDFNKTNKEGKHTKSAAVTVLDAKTGDALALVSYPYYNISDYSKNYSALLKADGNPLMNYALNGTYRPGSTFKPTVAAAGLTEGTINPSSIVTCRKTYTFWEDYRPQCLGNHHDQNVSAALQHSCNIFFYDVGRILGIDKINKYAELFGLGVDTGIELKSAKGNLSSPEFSKSHNARWEKGNVVQAAIGQMDTAVTPLQLAVEAMTIANKGKRYNVNVINKVLSNDGKTTISEKKPTVASEFKLSDSSYKAITDGMVLVGDAIRSPNQVNDLGYQVAIKTGSPQVTKDKTNHAFIAYAPTDEPEIAISCMMDDGYSSQVLTRKILLAYEKSKGIVRPELTSSTTSSDTSQTTSSTTTDTTASNSSSDQASSETAASDTAAAATDVNSGEVIE